MTEEGNTMSESKPLTLSMDNVHASRLGQIASAAGNPNRKDIGDSIDRGLILLKLLTDAGFVIRVDDAVPYLPVSDVIAAHERS